MSPVFGSDDIKHRGILMVDFFEIAKSINFFLVPLTQLIFIDI